MSTQLGEKKAEILDQRLQLSQSRLQSMEAMRASVDELKATFQQGFKVKGEVNQKP
jgi:hypothetical protein